MEIAYKKIFEIFKRKSDAIHKKFDWKVCCNKIREILTRKKTKIGKKRKFSLKKVWKVFKKVLKVFASKTSKVGNIEFLSQGIMNWNTRKLGVWNPDEKKILTIDFNNQEWFKQLPFNEIISREDINRRYGVSIEKGKWLHVYHATRDVADLSPTGRHGFLEIAMPLTDGRYALFPFGSYPLVFPSGLIASILSVNDTSLGSIAYPDDNISMLHRQHAVVPTEISSDEGLELLEAIRKELIKTQIFQLRGENCAFWAQNTSEKISKFKSKNPFKINLKQSNTFLFIGKIPIRYQPKFLNALDFILGERRGLTIEENGQKVFKSISLIPQEEKMYIYQPGWLHEQIKAGNLPGRIYVGAS